MLFESVGADFIDALPPFEKIKVCDVYNYMGRINKVRNKRDNPKHGLSKMMKKVFLQLLL